MKYIAPSGAVCFNIEKDAHLPLSRIDSYHGAHVDNIFILCPGDKLSRKFHESFGKELVRNGLVLSEESSPREQRKLLGGQAEGGRELPGLKAPEDIDVHDFPADIHQL